MLISGITRDIPVSAFFIVLSQVILTYPCSKFLSSSLGSRMLNLKKYKFLSKTWIWMHTDKNAKICTHFADGATVLCCCKLVWVWLGWLQRLRLTGGSGTFCGWGSGTFCGWGYGGWFLPALDKDQSDMITQSELCLYLHAQHHRLLTLDILGYPSLLGDILC